jgi:hypothetical protein
MFDKIPYGSYNWLNISNGCERLRPTPRQNMRNCIRCDPYMYREGFYLVDRFHSCALHGDRCTAGCEAHKNFADKSARLTADNVRN